MSDQIIDAQTALAVQADAARAHVLFGWIIMRDLPDYPGKFIGRLATARPTIYVLQGDTLAELRTLLPPGLTRSDRQLADPSVVVEIWFAT